MHFAFDYLYFSVENTECSCNELSSMVINVLDLYIPNYFRDFRNVGLRTLKADHLGIIP